MKRLWPVVLLSVVSFAQKPVPNPIKTGAEADKNIFQMRQQIDTLRQQLENEPKFQQWQQLQQKVEDMKVISRVLHQNENEAASLAVYKAKLKKQ